jgi:hypothetical protein
VACPDGAGGRCHARNLATDKPEACCGSVGSCAALGMAPGIPARHWPGLVRWVALAWPNKGACAQRRPPATVRADRRLAKLLMLAAVMTAAAPMFTSRGSRLFVLAGEIWSFMPRLDPR